MQAVQSEPPSVGGTLTGWGGDIIILDDPHKPEDAASEKKRNSVLDWFKSTLLSRLNDPGAGPIILIQQRVHEGDLAGYLLEQGGWEHLDLTSTAEEPNTIELGSYVFAAQYQQRPAPLGGGIVKWDWFHTYDVAPARIAGDRIIQSWDTASKADEANDYSVCTTWLVRGDTAWLLDVYRAKLEFPDLRKKIVVLAEQQLAKPVLIEEAGSGVQLLQDLRTDYAFKVKGIIPKDDKGTRLLSVSHMIESGSISMPSDAPWLAAAQREITLFPNGKYDGQVDSLSQFLKWFTGPKPATLRVQLLNL